MNLYKITAMELIIKDKKHLHSGAKKLIETFGSNRIIAFYGSMGAGKTTIIKAVCEELGVLDIISSPTFTLVNEYKTVAGEFIYHIDFYRIKKQEEVFDFGIEEYLSGENYCFMEWPELIEDILPANTLKVRISVEDDEKRVLKIS